MLNPLSIVHDCFGTIAVELNECGREIWHAMPKIPTVWTFIEKLWKIGTENIRCRKVKWHGYHEFIYLKMLIFLYIQAIKWVLLRRSALLSGKKFYELKQYFWVAWRLRGSEFAPAASPLPVCLSACLPAPRAPSSWDPCAGSKDCTPGLVHGWQELGPPRLCFSRKLGLE